MSVESSSRQPVPWPLTRAVVLGGLIVGVLDMFDAFLFFGARGVPPLRIFQAVAGGLLGRDAFQGGVPTFILGLALHYVIATIIAAIYILVSRKLPVLVRRPVLCGLAYGVVAFFVMQYVVVPLSALGGGGKTALPVLINGIVGHALLVGLPSAWAARRALNPPPP